MIHLSKYFIAMMSTFLVPIVATSQWSTSTTVDSTLAVCGGFYPEILSNRDGSSFVCGTLSDKIYVQKLDPFGYPVWPQPVVVHYNENTNTEVAARLVSDGDGGVLVYWIDYRDAVPYQSGYANNAIYMQRVDRAGVPRWDPDGVVLAPVTGGLKHAIGVSDLVGGAIYIVAESDFLGVTADRIERLWACRRDSSGQLIWQKQIDSSTVWGSISFGRVAVLGQNVFIQASPGNHLLSIDGSILSVIAMPNDYDFASSKDSILFGMIGAGGRDTINGDVYVYLRISKYDQSLDTIWSTILPVLLDGPYQTFNKSPIVPDGNGGIFAISSTYDDAHNLESRVFHVNSSGEADWPMAGSHLNDFATGSAYNDGIGGIVMIDLTYSRAARFGELGEPIWPGQPVLLIDSPIDTYFDLATGDNNGGAIVCFWTTSGEIHVQHTGRTGSLGVITSIAVPSAELPAVFELSPNYPNPFNSETVIKYSLTLASSVKLTIVSLSGQIVATLIDRRESAGVHTVPFVANGLPSGVYFYSMQVGNVQVAKKLVHLK